MALQSIIPETNSLKLISHVRKFLYVSVILIVFGWLILSAWAYLSVLNTFGKIPSNDELISLSIEKNYDIAIVSPSFDEKFLEVFACDLFIGPIFIVLECIVSVLFKKFALNRLLLLCLALSIVTGILSISTEVFGWYFVFIVD